MVRNSLTCARLYSLSIPSSLTGVSLTSFPLGLFLTPDDPLSGSAAGTLLCMSAGTRSQGFELLFSDEEKRHQGDGGCSWGNWSFVLRHSLVFGGDRVHRESIHACFIHSASVYDFLLDSGC